MGLGHLKQFRNFALFKIIDLSNCENEKYNTCLKIILKLGKLDVPGLICLLTEKVMLTAHIL